MRVSTRLRLTSFVIVLALATLAWVVAWSLLEFQDARADYALAEELKLNFFERTAIRDQYLLYREERLRAQWSEAKDITDQLLRRAQKEFPDQEYASTLELLRRRNEESANIFSRIVANGGVLKMGGGNRQVYEDLDRRLVSQLLLKATAIRVGMTRLQSISNRHVEQAYQNLLIAFGIFALTVGLTTLLTAIQLGLLMRRRLEPLHAGARIIAEGNLDYRVKIDGSDEFADLALSFNAMTDKLQSFTWQLEDEIAEQKQTQLALHDSVDKLEAILNTSEVAIAWADENGRVEYVNPKFVALFGYTLAEVPTLEQWYLRAYPDAAYRAAAIAEWSRKLAHSLPEKSVIAPMEASVSCKDGGLRHVLLMGSWAGNKLLAVFSDITERKRAEDDLRIAAVSFESQEGMSVTDANNVILRVNRAFTEITGYSAAEVVGKTPSLFKSGHHDAAFYQAMWASLASSGAWCGEVWNRRKSGEVFPEWLTITAVKDAAGHASHYVATFTDITSRKLAEDQIRDLAFYDPLTHLPNRRLLLDRLKQALASSARSTRYGALLFIDLDNFKTINDTLGHDVGDLLLQQVARRLETCVREGDTVARLGGDEFVVMLEDLSTQRQESAAQVKNIGEKILAVLSQTYRLTGLDCRSTPSIGVTLFAAQQESVDELLKRADLAMYQAKAEGRNTLRFFDPEMQAVVTARAALEADLREAVLKNQFQLYYQAQVDDDGTLTGVEALLRWRHPQRGIVSPAEFIPLAESTGLILPMGRWVLETACAQLMVWTQQPAMEKLTIAVNVSARQFHHPDFAAQVLAVLEQSGADPRQLKLELTESLLVDDVEDVIAKMTVLKAKGVSFSLDDFGTGYSSLSYLKRLPLDQLKIDQGFVRDILVDPNDAAIAKMVVSLAESMGLAVIAEGVETQCQKDFLTRQGCHAYQGFLFSRPLPLAEFEAFVQRGSVSNREP